jgi:hypothetical protein
MNTQALKSAMRNIVAAHSIGYVSVIAMWAKHLAKEVLRHFGEDPILYYSEDEIACTLVRCYTVIEQCEAQLDNLHIKLNEPLSEFTAGLIKESIASAEKEIEKTKLTVRQFTGDVLGLVEKPNEQDLYSSLENDSSEFGTAEVLALIKDVKRYMPEPDGQEVEAIAMLDKATSLLSNIGVERKKDLH